MKLLLSFSFLFIFSCSVFSQDCEVAIASIQGKYTGGCKNKKADGVGKAEGVDMYDGSFKSGYPYGQGVYTYKNGDFFVGNFKKGVKEGEGEFHFKKTEADSIVKGFWKNDVYVGAYLRPFEIIAKSSGFNRLDVKPDVGLANTLTIVSENTIRNNSISNAAPPLPVVTYFNVSQGSYEREERSTKDKTTILVLTGLKFPFEILVNYGDENFQVLISKEGVWNIL
ncbi:MAG: hypothetical protein ABI402_19455, partial [Ferruginibacter sp.]